MKFSGFSLIHAAVFLSFVLPTHSRANLFGDRESRIRVDSSVAPWKHVGRVDLGGLGYCTGVLVGKRLVLTAAHCINNRRVRRQFNQLLEAGKIVFQPGYHEGNSRTSSHAISYRSGTSVGLEYYTADDYALDWLILVLKDPLGQEAGFFTLAEFPSRELIALGRSITHSGYHRDFLEGKGQGAHVGCAIRDEDFGILHHDCDSQYGASGGPLFIVKEDQAVLVGLASGHKTTSDGKPFQGRVAYSMQTANLAVQVSSFLNAVTRLNEEHR